jgi:hypothetical protein
MHISRHRRCHGGQSGPAKLVTARFFMAKRSAPSSRKDGKAVECLLNGREALLAFSDFPAGHWKHLRTANVIRSSLEATAKRESDGLERDTSGPGIML